MPRNASGVYTLPSGTAAISLTTISSTAYNNAMNDIAAALTQSVATTGVSTMTGALNMGSQKITNLATPTAATDGATKGYIDTGSSLSSFGGFLNKLRNGTMDIWQRGVGPFSTANTYTADGWILSWSGVAATVNQTTGRLLSRFGLAVQGAAGNTAAVITQRIESAVAAPLTSQQVTFQARVYNGAATAFTPQLQAAHANAVDNFGGGVTIDLAYTNLQTCPPGQWTLVSYSWTMTANAALGVQIAFNFGAVAVITNAITELDLRVTPGVATGLVANPPPPELRPISIEAPVCWRYYLQKTNADGIFASGQAISVGVVIGFGPFPTLMRTAPTVTLSPSYANLNAYAATGGSTSFTGGTITATSTGWTLTPSGGSGLVAGNATNLYLTSGGVLTASAEL